MPTLTVRVTPDAGATIRVAGQVVKGDTVEVAREPGYVSVAVAAPGYFPYRKLVEVRQDTLVEVTLRPLPSKRHHAKPWILLAMVVFALVRLVLSC